MANNMTMPTLPSGDVWTTPETQRYLTSMHYWLQNLHINGLQATQFEATQISNMSALSQVGKLFYDTDNDVPKFAIKSGGTLQIKEVQLA